MAWHTPPTYARQTLVPSHSVTAATITGSYTGPGRRQMEDLGLRLPTGIHLPPPGLAESNRLGHYK